jgi:predicted signal transduction protein with EAL and GGDEF domain
MISHINDFYNQNPSIPIERRPDIIHVAGKLLVIKAKPGMSIWDKNTRTSIDIEPGTYNTFTEDCDLQGILWTLDDLQNKALTSSHINFSYGELINGVMKIGN